jgi:hypothetical protein
MKHLIKTATLFVFLIFSGNILGQNTVSLGQELLGKEYDYIIKKLDSDKREYKVEILDNEQKMIEEYVENKNKNTVCRNFYFVKRGKKMICNEIEVWSPEKFYGSLWQNASIVDALTNGYEKTNDVHYLFDESFFKSNDKYFKNNPHYKMRYHGLLLSFYLDTSSYKIK